jgi:hypothetical protein
MKGSFAVVLVVAALVLAAYGCVSYGTIRSQMVYGNGITVQDLVRDRQNYTMEGDKKPLFVNRRR